MTPRADLRRGAVRRSTVRSRASLAYGAALLALGGLAASGCSDSSSWSASSGSAPPEIVVQEAGGPSIFERMRLAPSTVAFRGTRRVVLHRDSDVYDFTEEVGADGSGRFAVEVPGVQRVPASLDPVLAPLFLQRRGAFAYRVRDPRIVDLALLADRWNLRVLSRSISVAGHACWRMELERRQPLGVDDVHYELDVEPASGLVLGWRETTASGAPVSSVEYQSLTFGADVSDMDLVDRAFPVRVLDPLGDLSNQVGARVYGPDLAPPGFELEVIELIEPEPGVEWVKFVYTDGLERTFFLHRVDRTQGPSAGLPSTSSTSRVDHAPFGAWTFALGDVNGVEVVAAGKVPPVYIGDLIESAVQ